MASDATNYLSVRRFAWLSIAAAIVTIGLKTAAYYLTGSVGLLSDALESLVNLAAAVMALVMLTIAARPADEEHAYGHGKAEYFASGVEGGMILVAAVSISLAALRRLVHPEPLAQLGLGLIISGAAALINLVVGRILLRASRQYHSIALEADAQHLLTDVWTSAGVLIGVGAVAVTGWEALDPIVALLAAAHILRTGARILRQSILGLMDTALPTEDLDTLRQTLQPYLDSGIEVHALRSRQSGARRFVSFHVVVPGEWTVYRGHQLLEQIEADVRRVLPNVTVFTHLEAFEDPASWADMNLDREAHRTPGGDADD